MGFVDALKMTLRHCGGRASATALAGIPARVQASASGSIAARSTGLGSNGPNVVSPFTSHCTTPGSSSLPAGNVVPRTTRSTCSASVSSLPTPFITDATAPRSRKTCAVAAIAGPACMAFVATMPNSQGGIARASLVALGRPLTSPAPTSRSPFRAIASTCAWLRSNAHTSTSSSVARLAANSDPTAPQPTTQTLMASPLVRRQDAADAGDQARTRDRRSVRTAAGRAPAP